MIRVSVDGMRLMMLWMMVSGWMMRQGIDSKCMDMIRFHWVRPIVLL